MTNNYINLTTTQGAQQDDLMHGSYVVYPKRMDGTTQTEDVVQLRYDTFLPADTSLYVPTTQLVDSQRPYPDILYCDDGNFRMSTFNNKSFFCMEGIAYRCGFEKATNEYEGYNTLGQLQSIRSHTAFEVIGTWSGFPADMKMPAASLTVTLDIEERPWTARFYSDNENTSTYYDITCGTKTFVFPQLAMKKHYPSVSIATKIIQGPWDSGYQENISGSWYYYVRRRYEMVQIPFYSKGSSVNSWNLLDGLAYGLHYSRHWYKQAPPDADPEDTSKIVQPEDIFRNYELEYRYHDMWYNSTLPETPAYPSKHIVEFSPTLF